jgi:hypothetical protein
MDGNFRKRSPGLSVGAISEFLSFFSSYLNCLLFPSHHHFPFTSPHLRFALAPSLSPSFFAFALSPEGTCIALILRAHNDISAFRFSPGIQNCFHRHPLHDISHPFAPSSIFLGPHLPLSLSLPTSSLNCL